MFPSLVPGVLCPALGIDTKHRTKAETMSDSELDSGTVSVCKFHSAYLNVLSL